MDKKPLLILTGPTAVGKTETSIQLAKAIGGEIISADSMQVYRGMDIGTAKIKPHQMQGIPHYLVDEFDPDEEFNVMRFQQLARKYMEDIYSRNKIPILVGGTGFYIQSVLYDIAFTENQEKDGFRERMNAFAKEHGTAALHEQLRKIDSESADRIHPNNVKRVIRALEYHHFTGEKISAHNDTERKKKSPYCFLYIVLDMERQKLYDRINRRVDDMVENGLVEEVERLLEQGYHKGLVSMQGLGYKELIPYLEHQCSLEEAVYRIKRDTRHFAKRQMTWFRRERDVTVLDKDNYTGVDDLVGEILQLAKERGVIS